jgi:hypothetical protein
MNDEVDQLIVISQEQAKIILELRELNEKQDQETSDQNEFNTSLEERVVELERMIREIVANQYV